VGFLKLPLVGLALAALTCTIAQAEGDRSPRSPPVARRAPVHVESVEPAIVTPAAIAASPAPAQSGDAGGAIFSPFSASTRAEHRTDTAKASVDSGDSDSTLPIVLAIGGLASLGYAVRRVIKAS
jgi:hypothetical protein